MARILLQPSLASTRLLSGQRMIVAGHLKGGELSIPPAACPGRLCEQLATSAV